MSAQAYVFDARLADDSGVSRTVAVGSDQTLDDGRDYAAAPGEAVDVPLARLGLRTGSQLEHDVEGPEEWRLALTVLDVRLEEEPLPRVLERQGEIALEPEAELGGED